MRWTHQSIQPFPASRLCIAPSLIVVSEAVNRYVGDVEKAVESKGLLLLKQCCSIDKSSVEKLEWRYFLTFLLSAGDDVVTAISQRAADKRKREANKDASDIEGFTGL